MSLPVRLGLFYSAIFIGVGAGSPYMPLWFAERGLSGAQIGLILSLPMIARVVTAPLLAVWADSFRLRRTALIFMSLAVAVAYALMALPLGFVGWTVVWFAASSAFAGSSFLAGVPVEGVAGAPNSSASRSSAAAAGADSASVPAARTMAKPPRRAIIGFAPRATPS